MQYLDKFPVHFQQSPEFREAWKDWLIYRKTEKKSPVGPVGASRQANKLSLYTPRGAAAMLNQSMERGYTGIFPAEGHLPSTKTPEPVRKTPREDIDRIPAEELAKLTASIRAKGFPEAGKQNEDERRAFLRAQGKGM